MRWRDTCIYSSDRRGRKEDGRPSCRAVMEVFLGHRPTRVSHSVLPLHGPFVPNPVRRDIVIFKIIIGEMDRSLQSLVWGIA